MAEQPRVLQVNVSAGGVPKTPIERAWVERFGLVGDGHTDRTVHGGPHRAVCLYGIEAIGRLQAEGHPVGPGSVGENLTTRGVEWSNLPVGTRVRIGGRLLLELSDATSPCSTLRRAFSDGRFSRISIELHPSDSRMYARVLEAGFVQPGDPIELLPPLDDSAERERLLARLDLAGAKSSLAGWRAAAEVGHDVRIVDDGELMMVASPQLPGPEFNQALGLARLPNLLADAQAFFDEHASEGWLVIDPADAPAPAAPAPAAPDEVVSVFAAPAAEVAASAAAARAPAGVTIRPMLEADLEGWAALRSALSPEPATNPRPPRWAEMAARELASSHLLRLIALEGDQPVGAATLYVHRRTGWLRAAFVVPAARGRGLQRALVGVRAAAALERGCDVIGAWAAPGGISASNLAATGMATVGQRVLRRYRPAGAGRGSGLAAR